MSRSLKQQPTPFEDVTLRKVKHLPMPGPGIRVSVPLGLLPRYLELYGLEPTGYRGGENVLLVRRVSQEAAHEQESQ